MTILSNWSKPELLIVNFNWAQHYKTVLGDFGVQLGLNSTNFMNLKFFISKHKKQKKKIRM